MHTKTIVKISIDKNHIIVDYSSPTFLSFLSKQQQYNRILTGLMHWSNFTLKNSQKHTNIGVTIIPIQTHTHIHFDGIFCLHKTKWNERREKKNCFSFLFVFIFFFVCPIKMMQKIMYVRVCVFVNITFPFCCCWYL